MNNCLQAIDRSSGDGLRGGFVRQCREFSSAPALAIGGDMYSYETIDMMARLWAGTIVRRLKNSPARVGVFAHRSLTSYVGTLAALFSGGAFVPLNPTFPVERTATMIGMADLDVIIVDDKGAAQLEKVVAASGLKTFPLVFAPTGPASMALGGTEIISQVELEGQTPLQELPDVLPEDIAYLLFTSGSTGQPKGVPVTHSNVCHFLRVMANRYDFTSSDKFSQTFDQTFDLSVFDLFVAWQVGACICAMQPLDLLAPARFIARHGVTVWFSVPSIPALMRKKGTLKPGIFPTLRWSLFCGEPLPQATAEEWQAAAPDSTVENLYGPTELTIACLVHRWKPITSPEECVNEVVPIGRPFEGLGVLVLDESRKPVPPGEPGELYVSGPQTFPGYWRDPRKTMDSFLSFPVNSAPGIRFYRTGDRVLRSQNGDYVHLGRVDHQIKVLGHRVELGEIEAGLRRYEGVLEAVAIGWPEQDGTTTGIIAFISGREVDIQALKAQLRLVLPEYMVPTEIHHVAEMPLNSNGKIDRKTLVTRLECI